MPNILCELICEYTYRQHRTKKKVLVIIFFTWSASNDFCIGNHKLMLFECVAFGVCFVILGKTKYN